MSPSRTRFDEQAAGFDSRAGLGPDVARAVAAAILAHSSGTVLELGPGTGELGELLAGGARRYVGIDASRPMLDAFALRRPPRALLVLADAAQTWPVRPSSIDLVFAARSAHLIDPGRLVAQLASVGRPGATFLVGRVDRQGDGLRSLLRERRRALLAEHGLGAGDGRRKDRRLFETLTGVPLPKQTVATWTVQTSADDVIANWERNGVAGGRPVPTAVAATVLDRLRDELGGQSQAETETYTLEGVRLP